MGPVSFLTPLAALVALIGLLPVAAFLARERRATRVRRALHLSEPLSTSRPPVLASLVATAALTGVAAAQPVIDRADPRPERSDAEIFFAFDTSRSMLAASAANEPTRFERARSIAEAVRVQLPDVPAGIAQFTDSGVRQFVDEREA